MRKYIYFLLVPALCLIISCNTSSTRAQQQTEEKATAQHKYTNELVNESSPYLLQHAHNPVNWYPWGEKALNKAKKEDKLIIISVGYAACHWCHVMEHESFEDSTVAKIMNDNFVCIKVDREERPDVDDVYMTACHLSGGGSCGWPLNAFALPDGRPFWAGTYFPKKTWLEILDNIQTTYEKEPEKIEEGAGQIMDNIQRIDDVQYFDSDEDFTAKRLDKIADKFLSAIDMQKGGRKANPSRPNKFPMPNNYQFLLEYYHQTEDKKALEAVEVTLDNIANGGIYDHVGGGFARYSTDPNWKVPHFEKMMYDNGQLVSLYSSAYQLIKNPLYKQRVYETLDWVEREMTSPEGGFYSSLDADSEGEEGKFYVWTKEEIDAVLDSKTARYFNRYYNVKETGNWEHGVNILHVTSKLKKVADRYDMKEKELQKKLLAARASLLAEREKRPRPLLDDKVLTSWNALMMKGYIDAYRAFGDQKFLDVALRNANFIVNNQLQANNRLNRNYKDGKSVINAFLDDYALLTESFIALYQATFDEQWLNKAKDLTDYTIQYFHDEKSQLFFYTSSEDPALVARKKELSDNVISGSNSVMAKNLFYLGTYLYKQEYLDLSEKMLKAMVLQFENNQQPNFYANWCSLMTKYVEEPYEVAIVGKDWSAKRIAFDQEYLPNVLFLGGKDEGSLELLQNKLNEGETMIYVCKKKVCKLPVTEVDKALKLLE